MSFNREVALDPLIPLIYKYRSWWYPLHFLHLLLQFILLAS